MPRRASKLPKRRRNVIVSKIKITSELFYSSVYETYNEYLKRAYWVQECPEQGCYGVIEPNNRDIYRYCTVCTYSEQYECCHDCAGLGREEW